MVRSVVGATVWGMIKAFSSQGHAASQDVHSRAAGGWAAYYGLRVSKQCLTYRTRHVAPL
jgi:hypothetical protein